MPNTNLRNTLVDQQTTQNPDFHGRRITNAGDGVAPQDYVTVRQALGAATIIPGTITLFGPTTNGSLTIDKYGRITSYVEPT